jgi:hypothetical protein
MLLRCKSLKPPNVSNGGSQPARAGRGTFPIADILTRIGSPIGSGRCVASECSATIPFKNLWTICPIVGLLRAILEAVPSRI